MLEGRWLCADSQQHTDTGQDASCTHSQNAQAITSLRRDAGCTKSGLLPMSSCRIQRIEGSWRLAPSNYPCLTTELLGGVNSGLVPSRVTVKSHMGQQYNTLQHQGPDVSESKETCERALPGRLGSSRCRASICCW